jgi:hypothetical protein
VLTSLQALLRLATLRWLGVFICALATLLATTSTASALEPAQTKTRVWGFDFAKHNSAGLFRAASSGKHQENRSTLSEVTSGSLLAAEGAPLALPAPTMVNPWAGVSVSTTAAEPLTMFRVWGGEAGQIGSWLTPVSPTSSAAARAALALPEQNAALFVSKVIVPTGTRFQIGTAGAAFGQPGGAVQLQLLERIPASLFGEGVPLP